MKTSLRKILLTALCAMLGIAGASAQFRYGPTASVNFNSLSFKQKLFTVGQSVGADAGIMGELMFPGIGFGIDFGLQYNMMGAKTHLGEKLIWSSQGYDVENVMIHNIQIPVHIRFKWTRMDGLEDYIAPFVYGGPDFAIQAGHSKIEAFKFSGGDLGLTVGLGAEVLRRWQISGQYTWGMTYALKTTLLDNFSAQNRQWSIKVAYLF